MTPVSCIACQGTGVGPGRGTLPLGTPLPLCPACDGLGALTEHMPAERPFRAIWLVGTRYTVRMTVPRRKGVVELDLEWDPLVPPTKGPGKLKPEEMRQYREGRDTALRTLNLELGGDFSIIEAGERH